MPHACASHYIKDMQGQGQGYCSNKRGRGELFPTTASGRKKMHISSPLSSFIHYFLYLMTSPRSSSATVRYLDSRLIDAIGYNEGEIYVCSYLHLISSKWDKKMMCWKCAESDLLKSDRWLICSFLLDGGIWKDCSDYTINTFRWSISLSHTGAS